VSIVYIDMCQFLKISLYPVYHNGMNITLEEFVVMIKHTLVGSLFRKLIV